mmetsp:Transcript_15382/g.28255  ORF Transcript_15382/g.28255 Transcript_15382/m.28255 type:complete len:158 (+) Transcript_15382:803-1276(+)
MIFLTEQQGVVGAVQETTMTTTFMETAGDAAVEAVATVVAIEEGMMIGNATHIEDVIIVAPGTEGEDMTMTGAVDHHHATATAAEATAVEVTGTGTGTGVATATATAIVVVITIGIIAMMAAASAQDLVLARLGVVVSCEESNRQILYYKVELFSNT